MKQAVVKRKQIAVKTDHASIAAADQQEDAKQDHPRVGRDGAGQEESEVHHDPKESGSRGQAAEDQAKPDEKLAQRDQKVEQLGVRQGEALQKCGEVRINHFIMAGNGVGNGVLQKFGGLKAFSAGQLAPACGQPLPSDV